MELKDNIKFALKIIKNVLIILFCLSGSIYFMMKLDESKLDKIRYCSNCGYDLIHNIEKK